jgi:hypothetical protein
MKGKKKEQRKKIVLWPGKSGRKKRKRGSAPLFGIGQGWSEKRPKAQTKAQTKGRTKGGRTKGLAKGGSKGGRTKGLAKGGQKAGEQKARQRGRKIGPP